MSRLLNYGDITIDLTGRTSTVGGTVHALTEREAEALLYLADRAGEVVSKRQMERDVWEFRAGVRSQAVPVAMRRLRAKVERDPSNPSLLLTVQGVGWKLVASEEQAPLNTFAPLQEFSTPFFPRPHAVAALSALVQAKHRILTVVGPGGSGKTRLANEAARQQELPICAVDLSTARTAHEANAVLLTALDQVDTSNLSKAVAAREPFLLLLDNLEHLMERAVHWATLWLPALPNVVTLCTSREALGVPGEVVYQMPPMASAQAAEFFQERARAVGVDIPQAAAIQIAEHLDGLPLALELYAAHSGLFTPEQLAQRLTSGVDLKLSRRGTADRLSSLDGTMAWSWSLLTSEEQSVLQACAVFPSRFDIAAATTVVPTATLPILASLRRKSLIVVDRGELSLLRSARGFLENQTDHAERAALLHRHAEWSVHEAEVAVDQIENEPLKAISRLEDLRPDLNQASAVEGDLGVRAALALSRSLADRGMPNERLTLLETLTTSDPNRLNSITVARAQAYFDALDLDTSYQILDGVHSPDAALLRARINRKRGHFSEITTQLDDLVGERHLSALHRAKALAARAGVYARTGRLDDAFHDLRQAETLCTQKRLRLQRISVWMTLASIQAMHGQFEEAEDTLDRLMAEADGRNLERAIEGAHHIYAYVLFERDPAVAAKHLQQSVAISLRTGDAERELTASADLAVARYLTGDLEAASERLEAVIPSLPPLGAEVMAFYTTILALIRIARGRVTSGRSMLERIDAKAIGRMLHDEAAGPIFLDICRTALDLANNDLNGARRRLAIVRGRAIGAPRMVRLLMTHFEGLVDDADGPESVA